MTHPSCPKHQAMATIEIRGQLRPGVCRRLCQEQGVPSGSRPTGRRQTLRLGAGSPLSMAPLVWGRKRRPSDTGQGQAGSHPSAQPRQNRHTCVVSSYRFVPGKPHSSGVLVSRTAQGKQGQPLSRLLVPRVQLSPARPDTVLRSPPQPGHWWPPVDPGPFPRAPQGTFSFDLAGNCWGGTPLHTTSHVVPTLLVATFKWPWGPPPRDTRAQSSASDQSSSLEPGSSSHPNIAPHGPSHEDLA